MPKFIESKQIVEKTVTVEEEVYTLVLTKDEYEDLRTHAQWSNPRTLLSKGLLHSLAVTKSVRGWFGYHES